MITTIAGITSSLSAMIASVCAFGARSWHIQKLSLELAAVVIISIMPNLCTICQAPISYTQLLTVKGPLNVFSSIPIVIMFMVVNCKLQLKRLLNLAVAYCWSSRLAGLEFEQTPAAVNLFFFYVQACRQKQSLNPYNVRKQSHCKG